MPAVFATVTWPAPRVTFPLVRSTSRTRPGTAASIAALMPASDSLFPKVSAQVGFVLLPVLVDAELHEIAGAHAESHPEDASTQQIITWLGALIPRVMFPGSLAASARQAGAEPPWTGRARPYAERALRLAADRLDAEGAWCHVRSAVWQQVTRAVARVDDEVIAHTDVFDQPCYTKKLAHAAPIGRLGNRLLACAREPIPPG